MKRSRFPSPPWRHPASAGVPLLPPTQRGDQGPPPGRPPRPGPRGPGQPRARAPSLSSLRKVSRRRSKRGAKLRVAWRALSWPRVMAAAVRRAAARMGRDSESFSISRGLLRRANSTRLSTILRQLSRETGTASAPPCASSRENILPLRHWLSARGGAEGREGAVGGSCRHVLRWDAERLAQRFLR